ncbi:hypothetical protein DPMN_125229 [Dreissena polymorpha]|uniref:Uncharacterized protein n=1 Tax=Dreissena polymorpha TaxID=45954 RepID=A0A9D4JSX2_DREPO|nr:hypothetical protein DPMN_125229 [Dreissena polymorpha]
MTSLMRIYMILKLKICAQLSIQKFNIQNLWWQKKVAHSHPCMVALIQDVLLLLRKAMISVRILEYVEHVSVQEVYHVMKWVMNSICNM